MRTMALTLRTMNLHTTRRTMSETTSLGFVPDGRTTPVRGIFAERAAQSCECGTIHFHVTDASGHKRHIAMRGAVAADVQDNLISLSAYHGHGLRVDFHKLRAYVGSFEFPIALVDDDAGNRVYTFIDARATDASSCTDECADVVLTPHSAAPTAASQSFMRSMRTGPVIRNGVLSASATRKRKRRNARLTLVHRRLGHANMRTVIQVLKADDQRAADGKHLPLKVPRKPCWCCERTRARVRNISRGPVPRPPRCKHTLCADYVAGPCKGADGKSTGILWVVDARHRKMYHKLVTSKGHFGSAFKEICDEHGISMRGLKLRVDSEQSIGRCTTFAAWFRQQGGRIKKSAPYRQSQNGMVERHIQSVHNRMLALLKERGLPDRMWSYAAPVACMIWNNLPRVSLGGKSPDDIDPDCEPRAIARMPVFGSGAWAHVPKSPRGDQRRNNNGVIFVKFGVRNTAFQHNFSKLMMVTP